ncbi:helix-turn-helix domain-containing protein [Halostella sp. JP-L12]|uniref:helix-turn-helix transcriptional regulator n=1 Tax=Halostella TaxID=1843185 RepID=UPI000EF7763C|nr:MULTISPECIES: helix-turn-helix domain-containing protein [Halostella]NHN47975.1 helix-turn-helix domain-containing protein [Halostella sp. JP-L12]
MISGSEDVPEEALSDVAFLARSVNRIRVLGTLSREAYPPRELTERTETSRSTLRRILSELEDRGWAKRNSDGDYGATVTGKLVVEELAPFVRTMETIRRLDDVVTWLPLEEIPLEHFSDATLIGQSPNNPLAPASFLTERLQGASEFQCLVRLAPPVAFEIRMRDAVVDGRLTTEHVITRGELDTLRDHPERLPRWREYINAGANVYVYDGDIPCNVFVFDETVVLGKRGHPFVKSEREAVRNWAIEKIESYREGADRLHPDTFVANSTVAQEER